jgi:DNA invertase Pin-like site-specific DNA recombinase
MAKESFDKEIQFLRMLVLTSGAYSRQQYAERLGISVHTFDKTLRRLKEILETAYQHIPDAERKQFADTLGSATMIRRIRFYCFCTARSR